ncbi:protoheme IX farnesyltransferase [Martiniozyma asiatica (nom. inval.)]|nr:protoheme IX farnesyltransferase [Martiniozyma asiatica]
MWSKSGPFFLTNKRVLQQSALKNICFSNDILSSSALRLGPYAKFPFLPNTRLRFLTTHNEPSKATETIAKVCHPNTTSTSHIPFEVKSKECIKDGRSVLQQYLAGEPKTFKQLKDPFWTLTKPSLTFLIMLSSICSYTLAPGSTDIITFTSLTLGTLLASGAANAINMGREPAFDSQMTRTSSRPVVTGLVTPKEAFSFATITGTLGCTILYFGVNPIVSGLGFLNIVLYSWLYTSLKRKSIINTWVGAVVGAIPPLMGWGACSSLEDPGAWCLALLLYAWQFPHFNSLSHNIRKEYKRAGYVMTAFVNPMLNARVSLRYSLAMFPICIAMSYFGVCDQWFILDSSIVNGWMTYMSARFWWEQRRTSGKGGAIADMWAKKTFWSSIWHLPLVLVLAMLHKQGQWDRFLGNEKKLD